MTCQELTEQEESKEPPESPAGTLSRPPPHASPALLRRLPPRHARTTPLLFPLHSPPASAQAASGAPSARQASGRAVPPDARARSSSSPAHPPAPAGGSWGSNTSP